MKEGQLLTGGSILRIIQIHVSTREDRGQVYTYEDLMAVQIRGEGKEADKDLLSLLRRMDAGSAGTGAASQLLQTLDPKPFFTSR
eukprot:2478126-Pyramimonas_sp.AAC.1